MSGKYFEELEVGMEFKHLPHRTITETDNFLFTALTHNPQPVSYTHLTLPTKA